MSAIPLLSDKLTKEYMRFTVNSTCLMSAMLLLFSVNFTQLHAEGTKTLVWGDGLANRVNLVFLAEGFTQSQQSRFLNYVGKSRDSFFLCQPWSNFKKLCNVYAIGVVSADSGCDYPADGVVKDTYFGASYTGSKKTGNSGYLTLASIDADSNITPPSKITALLQEHVPDCDILSIVVNDSYIPGAWAYIYMAPPYILMPTGGAYSPALVRHEIGHIFASLYDEYAIGSTLAGESKNTTAKTQRDQIRWNAWIDPATPVPTPDSPEYYGKIGLFEGACGITTGWYRPRQVCIMNAAYDTSSFCEVCREEIIISICKTISLVDSFSPANNAPVKNAPGAFLSIRPVKPDSFRLATQWSVNGLPFATASDTLVLTNAGLKAGPNTVVVRVVDSSGKVRIPENLKFVVDSVVWTIDNGQAAAGAAPLLSRDRVRIMRGDDGVHIVYALSRPQNVGITVWDMRGVLVYRSPSAMMPAGTHVVSLRGCDRGSGVYAVRLSSGNRVETAVLPVISR
jgi:hypothetical protein